MKKLNDAVRMSFGVIFACALLLTMISASSAYAQVIIDQDTTIEDGDKSLHGQDVIVRGATLTINGVHPLASLTVERNASNQPGVVTHSPGFEYEGGYGMWLIVDGDVYVQGADGSQVASQFNLSGRGYGIGDGPGGGIGLEPGKKSVHCTPRWAW